MTSFFHELETWLEEIEDDERLKKRRSYMLVKGHVALCITTVGKRWADPAFHFKSGLTDYPDHEVLYICDK
jgi:hypothetical protein